MFSNVIGGFPGNEARFPVSKIGFYSGGSPGNDANLFWKSLCGIWFPPPLEITRWIGSRNLGFSAAITHSASPRQNQETYREELRESDTVVSCVGGFGATSAYMDLVNGDTNVKLAEVR